VVGESISKRERKCGKKTMEEEGKRTDIKLEEFVRIL
jgi:hypothetical protein